MAEYCNLSLLHAINKVGKKKAISVLGNWMPNESLISASLVPYLFISSEG